MHEPKVKESHGPGQSLVPGRGGGAVAQNMPIRAFWETTILPPAGIPRYNGNGGTIVTGASVPANHALCIVCDAAHVVVLTNPGDQEIRLPFPAKSHRVIPIRQIGAVSIVTTGKVSWWIEDLRAMEPWVCGGEFRP